uniref:Ig-like domain-containing protein n=1 Tax=Myotis lucifugus TaxID=59463 RepID=G1Q7B1_MYOLU
MTSTLTALLCLGLSVGLRTPVQAGPLPKPTLWAEPGPVIPWKRPVTIWCQGTPGAERYLLEKEGSPAPWKIQEPGVKASFSITHMTERDAGRYRCYYLSPAGWSERSDPLELVVTERVGGAPSLSAQPKPSVPWGATVTLQCEAEIWFDTFHLHREGSLDPPQHLRLQDTSAPSQANFTLSPVTSGHQGTYRCYGSNSTSPYLLSQPSDPLELVVSDYTVENLIRIGVAGLVLVVLGVLLFQARNDTRRTHDAARM